MYPKKDEDDEEDDEEEDEEEEQSEKALAASNSGQVKKKCFRCGQWGHISRMCPQIGATGGGNQYGQGRYSSQGPGGPMNQWNSRPREPKPSHSALLPHLLLLHHLLHLHPSLDTSSYATSAIQ